MSNLMIRVVALFCGGALAGAALAEKSDASIVSEGLSFAMPAKLAVSEQFAKTGKWAESNAAAGIEQATNGSTSVNVGSGGLISVTFHSPSDLAGKSINLTPSDAGSGHVNWACKASDGFPTDALPKDCQ